MRSGNTRKEKYEIDISGSCGKRNPEGPGVEESDPVGSSEPSLSKYKKASPESIEYVAKALAGLSA